MIARIVTLCLIGTLCLNATSTLPVLAAGQSGWPAVTLSGGSRAGHESEIKAGYERVKKIKSPERTVAAEKLGVPAGTGGNGKIVVVGSITDQSVKEIIAHVHGPRDWKRNRRIEVTGDDRYAIVTVGDRERDPCCFGSLLLANRNATWILLEDVWMSH